MKTAEDKVSNFYNSIGWETEDFITEDARRFEDLRDAAKDYVSKCRLRVINYIPQSGEYILDMASGPIQYPEYLEYSKNFKKRYCVDLSSAALEGAKQKIGDHGVFLHGSFFDIPLEDNYFDCSISLHTIYHIDENQQEEAVRKLIDVTKPGKRVIIIYANPNNTIALFRHTLFFRVLKKAKRLITRLSRMPGKIVRHFKKPEDISGDSKQYLSSDSGPSLYYHAHPLEWWGRFSDVSEIQILPWRSLDASASRNLIPNNKIGKTLFQILFSLEERFPNFFSNHFTYPMIVLTKRHG
jgi:ubiquinone/menaquinone biosynthesis C-methylase UbiE